MARTGLSVGALLLGLFGCQPELSAWGGNARGAGCRAPAFSVQDIQGRGPRSAFAGRIVSVGGVVTAHRASADAPSGFFLQATSLARDALGSAGLFVALGARQAVPAPGRRVSVRGEVRELDGMTQLHSVELIQDCGAAALQPVRLSLADAPSLSSLEGLWVRLEQQWTLSDTGRLLGYAELSASTDGRVFAPGHELGQREAQPRWVIEDPALPGALEAPGGGATRLRLGARLEEATGVVYSASGRLHLLATEPLDWRGPAPTPPSAPPSDALRVVALNLDNYFVRLGARGAASEEELARQRTKLVAALLALDADLLALTELENDGESSLEHLLRGLNQELGAERSYGWSRATPPPGEALRAALAYRPRRLRALGEAWFEPTGALGRPAIFQRFEARHGAFSLGVVHFRSKRCGASPALLSPGGCNAEVRLDQARALLRAIEKLPSELLLMGDFNSDSLEAPLLELRQAGLVELLDGVPAEARYSYVFDGRASLLDHALGTPGLAASLRGAGIWHINADEPGFRSYRLDNPPAQYRADPFRCSDHDPVFIDLAL